MPIRTDPAVSPGVRTHSCSAVYFRSSGNTLLLLGVVAGVLCTTYRQGSAGSRRLRVTRLRSPTQRGHLDVLALLDVHVRVVQLEVVLEPAREPERGGEAVRVTDRVDHERGSQHPTVDADAVVRRLERGLRHHPDRVVDLHRLGAGI